MILNGKNTARARASYNFKSAEYIIMLNLLCTFIAPHHIEYIEKTEAFILQQLPAICCCRFLVWHWCIISHKHLRIKNNKTPPSLWLRDILRPQQASRFLNEDELNGIYWAYWSGNKHTREGACCTTSCWDNTSLPVMIFFFFFHNSKVPKTKQPQDCISDRQTQVNIWDNPIIDQTTPFHILKAFCLDLSLGVPL